MTMRFALAVACVITLCSCSGGRAEDGGEPERQLAAATAAGDVAKVSQLLTSGANPNKIVQVDGNRQSPWFLALYQARPHKASQVEIVKLMLKAGADPNEAWGTMGSSLPRQSAWQRFFYEGGARQSGFVSHIPIQVTATDADVVRALGAAGFNPQYGGQALVSAVESDEAETVHALVESGVDVNAYPGPITPLVAAIAARNVPLMTYLEEHGAREKP